MSTGILFVRWCCSFRHAAFALLSLRLGFCLGDVWEAKVIVVIGVTGAGKSSFCGLCDGSLHFEKGSGWSSNFKLGHGDTSETNEPKLCKAHWLGQRGGELFSLMDTPGLDDSRGPQQDEKHMLQVLHAIKQCPVVHGVVLLLKADQKRITPHFRKIIEAYQRILGEDIWDHCVIVVNRWSHDPAEKKKRLNGRSKTEKAFAKEFRDVMIRPAPLQALDMKDDQLGFGLTEDQAEAVPFYFIDTNYDREDTKEAESMKNELERLKMTLLSWREWRDSNVEETDLIEWMRNAETAGARL